MFGTTEVLMSSTSDLFDFVFDHRVWVQVAETSATMSSRGELMKAIILPIIFPSPTCMTPVMNNNRFNARETRRKTDSCTTHAYITHNFVF